MTHYCITAARPKGATNHLNSEFELYERTDDGKWAHHGWKSIHYIGALMQAGDVVLTGKDNGKTLTVGAPVELELRISKNDVNFKISEMPDG